jgi:hypothetical protein
LTFTGTKVADFLVLLLAVISVGQQSHNQTLHCEQFCESPDGSGPGPHFSTIRPIGPVLEAQLMLDPVDLVVIGMAIALVGGVAACWFWPVKVKRGPSLLAGDLDEDTERAIVVAAMTTSLL